MRHVKMAVGTGVLALSACVLPAAAEDVGEITRVVLYAYQQPAGGAKNPAFVLDPVIRDATVEAVRDGGAELTFLDGSTLTVGPDSAVVIDEFVYDPAANAGTAAMRVTKGFFRFVSGSMPDENVKIETDVVTIGIRGTIVTGGDAGDGRKVVNCVSGGCVVASKATPDVREMPSFTYVLADEEGNLGPVTPGLWWFGEPVIDSGIGFGNDGGNGPGAPDPGDSGDND